MLWHSCLGFSNLINAQQGSLNGFSQMGPDAATWRTIDGKAASIFGSDDVGQTSSDMDMGNTKLSSDLSVASHSLKNVTITKATLLQTWNNFPVPLGVTVRSEFAICNLSG